MLLHGAILNQCEKSLKIYILFFKVVKKHRKGKVGKAKKGKVKS